MTRSEKAISKLYGMAAEHRISMAAIADRANVTRVTLCNWRAGRSSPMLEVYLAVKEALDELVAEKQSVQ